MLESRNSYGYYGSAGGVTGESVPNDEQGWDGEIRRVPYRYYKQRYADCRTVPGSYDADDKSIEIIIPEGREKPSGVRGQKFSGYELWAEDADGQQFHVTYRAVCTENAMKQHLKWCRQNGCKPIEPPLGTIAHIYR